MGTPRTIVSTFRQRFGPRNAAIAPMSHAAGDTGFASTGTHYVDAAGRLLLSSSYRWSKQNEAGEPRQDHGGDYLSRVDECVSVP